MFHGRFTIKFVLYVTYILLFVYLRGLLYVKLLVMPLMFQVMYLMYVL